MSKGRVYIRTLGCPKNEADGTALIRHLEGCGWTVVDDPDGADVEIVNTCGFIEATKADSLDAIWEGVDRKEKASPGRRLVVTGCLAQRYGKQLASEIPSLDAVVGFDRPDLVAKALETKPQAGPPVCWVEKPSSIYEESSTPWRFDKAHPAPLSAYIKVGDGCDNACRFCAIPLIRGRLRSRSATAICDEIRYLVDAGTREVVLVSQDTTSWGTDLDNGADLADLLREIDGIPGDFWIRMMYAHPAFLTDRQVEAFGACEKLIPYLDMPLQHITDRMLSIMNRHTTRARTQGRIDALRRTRPGMAIRTTFIVGHPGETEADFEELLDFACENAFERMGVFVYSPEEGTPAARRDDAVPVERARERAGLLMEAFERWSTEQTIDKIGATIPCLLERRNDEGQWEGRTVHDAPDIDGAILVRGNDGAVSGPGLYPCRVTDTCGVDLIGSLAVASDDNAAVAASTGAGEAR